MDAKLFISEYVRQCPNLVPSDNFEDAINPEKWLIIDDEIEDYISEPIDELPIFGVGDTKNPSGVIDATGFELVGVYLETNWDVSFVIAYDGENDHYYVGPRVPNDD